MAFIRTVRGDIPPDELGLCLPHEHVLCSPPPDVPDRDLEMDSIPAAILELGWFYQAGGRSLVEMTPADYGRNAEGVLRVSEMTGVQIVCVTGHHKDRYSAGWVRDRSVDELAERFVADLTRGMDGTAIRAGAIKGASSLNTITPNEEKVLRAAARAQRATGAPISTHTEAGTMGAEQVAILLGEGATPEHVIIGHLDRKLEWDYLESIARQGVYLGLDQVSKEKYIPDAQRIAMIKKLVDAGYSGQILLAGDTGRKSYWPSYGFGKGPGLTYIPWRFVPWMLEEGIPRKTVEQILIENPARALQWTA